MQIYSDFFESVEKHLG